MTISINHLRKQIVNLFDLRHDTDEKNTVDSIRNHVEFRSGNSWTLIFAIFIASIGLNTNSAAVIIGAMLISPLMGPIVGAGLSLGISDFVLFRKSLRNLAIAVAISIATSFLYFWLSPLGEAQSELLARTRPTAFDVLIAIFGGASGIVASSRKEKGNAIPGVAIATALMPPLCTAGFGLASGQYRYFFGALYLFCINSVYICLSTYFFVRLLNFKAVKFLDPIKQKRLQQFTALIAVITFLPSAGLAWYFVQEAAFTSRISQFIKRELRFPGVHILEQNSSYSLTEKKLTLSLVGKHLTSEEVHTIQEKMPAYGLSGVELAIDQSSLEQDLEQRISKKLTSELSLREKTNQSLESEAAILREELSQFRIQGSLSEQLLRELEATFPDVKNLELTFVVNSKKLQNASANSNRKHVALVQWRKGTRTKQKKNLEIFLKTRLNEKDLVFYEVHEY